MIFMINLSQTVKSILFSTLVAGATVIGGLFSLTAVAFEDYKAPEILSVSINPQKVNTSENNQEISFTVSVKDDGVGICPIWSGDLCEPDGSLNRSVLQFELKPLIGSQSLLLTGDDFERISGDDNSATYRATKIMPRGSKVGIWRIHSAVFSDKLGNFRYLSEDSEDTLDDIGVLPNSDQIILSNTATSSSVSIDREWTIYGQNASATFPEGTVVTRKDGGSFAFYKMINSPFSLESVSQEGLSPEDPTTVVNSLKLGIPGLNLSFSNPVFVSMAVDCQYEGQVLQIKTLPEDGESWSNETECLVSDGECSFSVNHATFFAAVSKKLASAKLEYKVSTDTPELSFSPLKSTKTKINYTFKDTSFSKKQLLKMTVGGKKVRVLKVRKVDNGTIVTVELKYGKWSKGSYNLALAYKAKQGKSFQKESVRKEDALEIK